MSARLAAAAWLLAVGLGLAACRQFEPAAGWLFDEDPLPAPPSLTNAPPEAAT